MDTLLPIPGGRWATWRTVILRGTGFAVTDVLRLAAPATTAAADHLLAYEKRAGGRRSAALDAVGNALDDLRSAGLWDDKEKRRPLLKALKALSRNKLPKALGDADIDETFNSLRTVEDELAELRDLYEQEYRDAVVTTGSVLVQTATENRFREAVSWQNRRAVATALDPLLRAADTGGGRDSQRRQHEETVANYLQRYCTKNDTIGFFGPVGWARLLESGDPIVLTAGENLLTHREVYFENWAISALAATLNTPEIRPSLPPRPQLGTYAAAGVLHSPFEPPKPLDPLEERVLAALDGIRTANEVASELAEESIDEVFRTLEALCEKKAVTWALEVPLERYPERTLRRALERVELPEAREKGLAALDELEARRHELIAAAGDGKAVAQGMDRLEETFTRLTGAASQTHQGATYGARGLVYEDCRRETDVALGPQFLERLGPPLSLVLDSARWLAGELTRQLGERLLTTHEELRQRIPQGPLPSGPFFLKAFQTFFGVKRTDPLLTEVAEAFQSRWQKVLAFDPGEGDRRFKTSVAAVRERAQRAFSNPGPSWSLVHHLSPDLMVVSEGLEGFERGEVEVVLSELHASNTFLASCFLSQHPHPEELLAAFVEDMAGETVVLPQLRQDTWPQRMNFGGVSEDFYRFELKDQAPEEHGPRSLPAGAMVIELEDGRVVARHRDGLGPTIDAIELFAQPLLRECSSILGQLVPPATHRPRVQIDHLILARESWRFDAADLEFATLRDGAERFLAARRWAQQQGLPRFCFYKVPTEKKPCFLDLDSPIYLDLFARLTRTTLEAKVPHPVELSEMLPGPEHAWLEDASGNLYPSELRLTTLALAPESSCQ